MNDEQLQFAISQYVDGTLPVAEIPALEARLKADAQAQRTLVEYRQLNAILGSSLPTPAMDWDKLSQQISAAVDEQIEAASAPIPISSALWWRTLAIAASVALGLTAVLAFWVSQRQGATPQQVAVNESRPAPVVEVNVTAPPAPSNGVIEMAVLDRDLPQGEPVIEVGVSEASLPVFPQVLEAFRDVTADPAPRVLIAAMPLLPDTVADDELSGFY